LFDGYVLFTWTEENNFTKLFFDVHLAAEAAFISMQLPSPGWILQSYDFF